jgi:L-ascorbate metabolism protein UlaG (beta-lactamase superfamily)
MRSRIFAAIFAALLLPAAAARAATEVTWYGHAAFKIKTPSGKVILVDPWITNPTNKSGKEDVAALTQVDLILITHGHFDHVGDAVEIAKKTGAKLVATFDLASALARYAGYPEKQMGFDTLGNTGGELSLLGDEVKIAFVPAVHASTVAEMDKKEMHPGGNPGGFWISIKGGPTIYHTGDTDLFGDMALIPKFGKVDVMLTTIGDHFTMGPARAAQAVKLVGATTVVPMHFGTFPVLTGTPEAFDKELKKVGTRAKLKVMKPGETASF